MRFSTASVDAMVAAYLSRLLSNTFGQNVIVVDAGVLAVALGDDGTDGEQARERVAGETLAEVLDAVLVTADARLSRASGFNCEVEVISGGRRGG